MRALKEAVAPTVRKQSFVDVIFFGCWGWWVSLFNERMRREVGCTVDTRIIDIISTGIATYLYLAPDRRGGDATWLMLPFTIVPPTTESCLLR
jgi:hypothetical protein